MTQTASTIINHHQPLKQVIRTFMLPLGIWNVSETLFISAQRTGWMRRGSCQEHSCPPSRHPHHRPTWQCTPGFPSQCDGPRRWRHQSPPKCPRGWRESNSSPGTTVIDPCLLGWWSMKSCGADHKRLEVLCKPSLLIFCAECILYNII